MAAHGSGDDLNRIIEQAGNNEPPPVAPNVLQPGEDAADKSPVPSGGSSPLSWFDDSDGLIENLDINALLACINDNDATDYLLPATPTPVFVPVVQNYHCTDCHLFREIRHVVTELLSQFLMVHRDADSRFRHAIIHRMYTESGVSREETMLLDLSRQTQAWVNCFMARSVETMTNVGGRVEVRVPEVGSSSGAGAGVTAHTDEAEIHMLCEIFSISGSVINSINQEEAPAPAAAQVGAAANMPVVVQSITRPSQEELDAVAAAAAAPPKPRQRRGAELVLPAQQQREIRQFLIVLQENAERDIGRKLPVAIKKICNIHTDNRKIANRFKANLRKLRDLHQRSQGCSGKELLQLKKDGIEYVNENKRLYDALVTEAKRWQREDAGGLRCTPGPRKKNDGSGPSGGGGGAAAGAAVS